MLQRGVSDVDADASSLSNGHVHLSASRANNIVNDSARRSKALDPKGNASDLLSQDHDANGTKRRPPKRRRLDYPLGDAADSRSAARKPDSMRGRRASSLGVSDLPHADPDHSQRNGKHSQPSSSRPRDRPASSKSLAPTDIDGDGQSQKGLDRTASKSRVATSSPPATSSLGVRGSARMRTPSVLLSSQPGEKNASSQQNASSKNRQVNYCLRLVKDMLRLKDAFGFSKPIDQLWSVDQLPGYFDIVKQPMDLDTVRRRLEAGYYLHTPGKDEVEEVVFNENPFRSDMCLIFNNARLYNREGDLFYEAATRLLEKFESKMKQMPTHEQLVQQAVKKSKKRKKAALAYHESHKQGEGSKKRKGGSSSAVGNGQSKTIAKKKKGQSSKSKASSASAPARKPKAAKSPAVVKRPTKELTVEEMEIRLRALKRQRVLNDAASPASSPTGGTLSYKAQARALYKVTMTYEEKVELSRNVARLPPDKLTKIISLLKSASGPMEVNNNEEIEVDIDSMNNETLREMEAYVNQALYGKRKPRPEDGPNADIHQMSKVEVIKEIEALSAVLRKRTKGKSKELQEPAQPDRSAGGKKERSFYDSGSSSDSGDSEGSSSGYESSSDESDSSGDESGREEMKRRREQNLAHQQAMQAAGTPLPSPTYKGGS